MMQNPFFKLIIISCLFLMSCSSKGLKINNDEEIKFVQRESKIFKGSNGDVEIYVGDVTFGMTQIIIKGIEDNKIYLDREFTQNDEGYFKYGENNYYRIKVNKFENHMLHDDLAFISIREVDESVGKEKASAPKENNTHKIDEDEVRAVFNKIKNSKLKFIRNGEMLDDTTMAAHIESKYLMNQEDIKTKEDFNNRILTKSMSSGETYKVINGKDTIKLIDWVTGN